MIVRTQARLAKELGVSLPTLQKWRAKPWFPEPRNGPFHVDSVRVAAASNGMAKAEEAGWESVDQSGAAKLKQAQQAVSMQKKIADLELVRARHQRIILELKERQRGLLPVVVVRDLLMENATEIRALLVSLRQKGQDDIAQQIERVIGRIEDRVRESLKVEDAAAETV